MILEPENLSDADILAFLRTAQVLPRRGDHVLQRYSVNYTRNSNHRRISFRIWSGNKAITHLVVGRSLGGLHQKTEAFCRNNPEIGCHARFFFQHERLDFLGQECPSLINLSEAFASHQVDTATWTNAVKQTATALATTTRPSTMAKLMQEMVEFEQRVLGIASLTRLDQAFLHETVFPLIRTEASRRSPQTTWTNGDFTGKNILLSQPGRAHLIDYEFARRSHFPESNWFRFWNFSRIPEDIRLEDLCEFSEIPAWVQIRGWLEHAAMMNEICMPLVAQADLPKISVKLAPLVEAATGSNYTSVFFSLGPSTSFAMPADAVQPEHALVVEWSRQNSLSHPNASQLLLSADEAGDLEIELSPSPGRALLIRLRLPPNPCLLEVQRLEVRGRDPGHLVWSVDPAQLASIVTCGGNMLESATPGGLSIVHFGGESFITLPVIRLNKSETASTLVLGLRYVPNLTEFSQRLRRAFIDGHMPNFLADGRTGGPALEGINVPTVVTAQLYIPDGKDYRESHSIRTVVSEFNTWIDLTYDVPPLPTDAVLRFDPADQTGVVEVASITLEPVDHSFMPGQFPSHSRVRSWMSLLRCEGDAMMLTQDESVRILCFGVDANLKLAPLTSDFANRHCKLRISLCYSPVVPQMLWTKALQDCRDAALLAPPPVPALPESQHVPAPAQTEVPWINWRRLAKVGVWLLVGASLAGLVLFRIANRV